MAIVHLMVKLDNDRIMVQRKKVFRRPIEHVISWEAAVAASAMHVRQNRADKYFICAIGIYLEKECEKMHMLNEPKQKRLSRQETRHLTFPANASSLFKHRRRQRQNKRNAAHCACQSFGARIRISRNFEQLILWELRQCVGLQWHDILAAGLQAIGYTLWHSLFSLFFSFQMLQRHESWPS